MKQEPEKNQQQDEIPTAEWIVAGIGLALVCACLGFLLYKALFVENGTPAVEFRIKQITAQNGGALVLAEAINKGGETVTELQIMGQSGDERAEATIDFLPARSSRGFGMFFSEAPTSADVEFKAGGYQEP